MSPAGINRRTILRGFFGGALVHVALPPLEMFMNSHGTAYAEEGAGGEGFPKRFGIFFWGNGMLPDRWVPTGEGAEWELSEQLMPLAAVKNDITVVTGMRVGVPNSVPHHAGASGILTGAPALNPYTDTTMAGPTIDQIIANEVGGLTRFKSLEFGARPGSGMSYNGPHSKNPPESSPRAFFERLFGGSFQLPGEEPIVDPTLGLRRSILDGLMEDIGALKKRVSAGDKARLEQHFEGIRSLEKRLARLEEDPPNLAACGIPEMPLEDYPDIEGRPQLQAKNRAFSDTIALALACDQTRVFGNYFTKPLTNILFQGVSAGHHQLTHDEPGEQAEVNEITLQCIEGLAYQIEALSRVEEGAGTLLDNCLVFGTSEVSLGKTHSLDEFPIVLAGTCGGRIKKGIHYRSSAGDNASKVLLSICRAMGLDMASFGSEGGKVSEGLSEIEV